MPAYNVFNSRGALVTTINVGTTTGASFPIELIGQGISLYGPIVAQNQWFIMENFAAPTEPLTPIEGMFWYDTDRGLPNYYNGTNFIELTSSTSNATHGFEMLPTATAVDFTMAGVTNIFTAPSTATMSHHTTGVMLVPNVVNDGGFPPITPATFNVYIDTSEDIMENHNVLGHAANRHGYFPVNGMARSAAAAETVKLEVLIPATGTGAITLTYNVYLFGLVVVS